MTHLMKVKQEDGSSGADLASGESNVIEGIPAPSSSSQPINLDSPEHTPSLDDDQPLSKHYKIPQPSTIPTSSAHYQTETELEKQRSGRTLQTIISSEDKPIYDLQSLLVAQK